MSAPTPLAVGAVVVNYEAGAALVRCVASLRVAGASPVVVVDNGSRDGSLAALADADADAVLVPTGRNLGYGTAANRGVAHLEDQIDAVLVCNPDLEIAPDALRRLAAALLEYPDAAVVGPTIREPDGARYPSTRRFPSYATAVGHALFGLFWPDNRWSRAYRQEEAAELPADAGDAPEVDWVSGACFLVRREAFSSVSGFDEGYFMYVEDLDLCWRLRRAGWSVRYVADAEVVHEQGRSTARRPYRMIVAHHRSTWRFARRRATGVENALLPLIGAGIVLRCGTALVQRVLRGNPPAPSV